MRTSSQNSTCNKIRKTFRLACLSGLAIAGVVIGSSLPANAGSLVGTWSGTGTVKTILGKRERARCRVRYTKSSNSVYRMKASCGMSTGSAKQVVTLRHVGGNSYSGKFRSAKHNLNVGVFVTLNGNRITMKMKAVAGSAMIRLTRYE